MAYLELVRSPTFLIKIVELVMSLVIAGLTSGQSIAANPNVLERYAVVNGTIVGFIILGCLVVTGYVLECPLHYKLIIISSGAAALLFVTSGGLILDAYTRSSFKVTQVVIGGILAIFNGILYAADAFLSWRFR